MFTTSHHFPQISPESGAGEIQIFWNDGSRRRCHMLSLQSENQFPRLSGLWVAVTWFSDLKTKQLKNLKLKDLIIIHYPNKILERQPCGIGLYHLSLSPFRYLIGFNHHKCWCSGTHLQVAILFLSVAPHSELVAFTVSQLDEGRDRISFHCRTKL